jgi:hypothetical protein
MYFFTMDRSKEFYGAFAYILNTCLSHSVVLYRPEVVGDGWLIRVDRRRLWPQEDIRLEMDTLIAKLATVEPYFHTVGEVLVQERKTEKRQVTVQTAPYYIVDARGVRHQRTTKVVEKEVVVQEAKTEKAAEFSLHLLGGTGDASPILELAQATATPGFDLNPMPIMRADWFLFIASATLPEENGHYYKFRRISDSQGEGDKRKTAEQLWLEGLGVDYATVQQRQADQRIGQWRSNVTGKPRAIEYFYATLTRSNVGPAGVSITRDYFVGTVKAQRHAVRNLLSYTYDGSEAMAFLPNGMMEFTLFDGNGDLALTAPDKLVSDRTVPSPHQTILHTPISCIRCHGPTDMWMDASNDVLAMTSGPYRLNIMDDESDDESPEETLDRLAGLYAGEMTDFLRVNRNTHAKATYIVTGGMSIPEVSQKIGAIYNRYRYDLVTPQIACLEMGWVVDAEQAADHFNKILPLLPPNRHGVHPEDVTIGTLRNWTSKNTLAVNRDDWEQIYADAMLRVQTQTIKLQVQQGNNPQTSRRE